MFMMQIPEPSEGAARRRADVPIQGELSLVVARVEANGASPASVHRVRDWDGAPKPAGLSASAGAPLFQIQGESRGRPFTAGVVVGERAAPIISYMRDWTETKIRDYCQRKGWRALKGSSLAEGAP